MRRLLSHSIRIRWKKLEAVLRQGLTPEKLALSLSLGVVLGVFPVIGSTTALCAGAALALRLNHPAIQAANYLAYPLQFGLLLPWIRMGEWMLGGERLSWPLDAGVGAVATLRAVAAWMAVAPGATAVFYGLLVAVLRSPAIRRRLM